MRGAEALPPPPESVDPARIERGPWRGRFWFGFRLHVTGGVGGERPAQATAVAIGGGVDFGWRIRNWVGLATGVSGQIHDLEEIPINVHGEPASLLSYGNLFVWDIVLGRFFVPLRGRLQPYLDLGTGLVSYNRPAGGYLLGAGLRTGLGFDAWLTPTVTLGPEFLYRMTALEQRFADDTREWVVGHALQGAIELGFHW